MTIARNIVRTIARTRFILYYFWIGLYVKRSTGNLSSTILWYEQQLSNDRRGAHYFLWRPSHVRLKTKIVKKVNKIFFKLPSTFIVRTVCYRQPCPSLFLFLSQGKWHHCGCRHCRAVGMRRHWPASDNLQPFMLTSEGYWENQQKEFANCPVYYTAAYLCSNQS